MPPLGPHTAHLRSLGAALDLLNVLLQLLVQALSGGQNPLPLHEQPQPAALRVEGLRGAEGGAGGGHVGGEKLWKEEEAGGGGLAHVPRVT